MIRTSVGKDRYAAGEEDIVLGTMRSWNLAQPEGVLFCHGAGDTALQAFAKVLQRETMTALARHATVLVADLGFASFGNATAITRVGQAITYLRSTWGQSGPVVMVGISMGAITALAYTLAHPTEVKACALVIPGLDIADLHTHNVLGVPALIDAAYPPAYSDATDGPTHSPIHFAGSLPANLPIHLWTSSDDNLAVPSTADAFVAARPQTARTDLGALGHTDTAISAARPAVTDFVEQYTYL